jgi:hypothetical protein
MEKYIYYIFLIPSCLFAYKFGGVPEKKVSILFLISSFVTTFFVSNNNDFHSIKWDLFGIDLSLAIFLIVISLSADRYWTMAISSLQIVSAAMHPAFALSESKMAFAYAIAMIFWSYPMIIILIIGAMRYQQRLFKFKII